MLSKHTFGWVVNIEEAVLLKEAVLLEEQKKLEEAVGFGRLEIAMG